jgi:hypothetical protein
VANHHNNRRVAFSVVCATRIATQRCGEHICAVVNQHGTIGEAVFSVVAAPRLYTEDLLQPELEMRESRVELCEDK